MTGTDGAGTLTIAVDSTDSPTGRRALHRRTQTLRRPQPCQRRRERGQPVPHYDQLRDKGGAYRVTTSFQAAGNETCDARKTFTASDSDSNTISADSCFVTIAGSGDQSYYNYYDLTIPGTGLVDATAVSGDFNATLNLLDAGGNLLASNSGGAGYDAQGNVHSSLRAKLSAWSYRLQVFSDVPSGGAYSLKYAFQPGNPTPCIAAALNFGDVLTGTLSADSCRTGIGVSDVYTLTLATAGTVDLDMSASAFDTILVIRDSKDNLIVRNDDVDGTGASHITADLPAGTYTIVAAASWAPAAIASRKVRATRHSALYFAQTLTSTEATSNLGSAQLPRVQRPASRLLYVHSLD